MSGKKTHSVVVMAILACWGGWASEKVDTKSAVTDSVLLLFVSTFRSALTKVGKDLKAAGFENLAKKLAEDGSTPTPAPLPAPLPLPTPTPLPTPLPLPAPAAPPPAAKAEPGNITIVIPVTITLPADGRPTVKARVKRFPKK